MYVILCFPLQSQLDFVVLVDRASPNPIACVSSNTVLLDATFLSKSTWLHNSACARPGVWARIHGAPLASAHVADHHDVVLRDLNCDHDAGVDVSGVFLLNLLCCFVDARAV